MCTTCPGETTMLQPNRFHLVVSSSHGGPITGLLLTQLDHIPVSLPVWKSRRPVRPRGHLQFHAGARIAMSNVHTFWHANCAFICASLCWTLVFRHFSKLKSIADKVPRGDRSGTIPGPRGLMDRCETNSWNKTTFQSARGSSSGQYLPAERVEAAAAAGWLAVQK